MATEKRLIDANALYIELGKLAREPDYQHEDETWSVGVAMAMGEVWSAPTVDAVEVVHGRWVDRHYKIACSVCNHAVFLGTSDPLIHKEEKRLRNYCSNCGAKMDGERKDK